MASPVCLSYPFVIPSYALITPFPNPDTILGCDFSCMIAAVGPSVTTSVKVGDQVAGFIQGGHFKDRGVFAEYLKTPADLTLFHPARLGLTEPPVKVKGEKRVFDYGGSTSVGLFVIQLLAAAGYKVATVSSPHNFDGSIIGALDTQGASEGQLLAVKAFGPEGKGKIVTILGPKDEAVAYNPNIMIQPTLIYTSLRREFSFREVFPASKQDKDHMATFLRKVPELMKSGAIKPHYVKLWEGGLDGIEGGSAYMKERRLSVEKLVYKI
ncbi:hypothetical protein M422DRAFT_261735 [Sphaerobolus stellatus SS14]|uniref:Alcohol dehydrogenase-like N-terminal domain-containing protein n=1 Tax=Sphaerobolus stellatus (strain SS14) TaxID=990650 RepID=A0A0C9VEY4_SPHS4|nr:hypothetical protein M422DRAFT_261735 [Sphaerobolus stellatus SS14]